MVNKLLKIVNRIYGDIVMIDDSLTIEDIYDLVELCLNINPNVLRDEEFDFMKKLSINDLPKPTNASEQFKYLEIYQLITRVPPH